MSCLKKLNWTCLLQLKEDCRSPSGTLFLCHFIFPEDREWISSFSAQCLVIGGIHQSWSIELKRTLPLFSRRENRLSWGMWIRKRIRSSAYNPNPESGSSPSFAFRTRFGIWENVKEGRGHLYKSGSFFLVAHSGRTHLPLSALLTQPPIPDIWIFLVRRQVLRGY